MNAVSEVSIEPKKSPTPRMPTTTTTTRGRASSRTEPARRTAGRGLAVVGARVEGEGGDEDQGEHRGGDDRRPRVDRDGEDARDDGPTMKTISSAADS